MLNFNGFESMNSYAHSIIDASSRTTLSNSNGTNFLASSTTSPVVSLASTTSSNPSCQQQMSTNYLNENLQLSKIGGTNPQKQLVSENLSVNWSNSGNINNNNEDHHSSSNHNNNNNNNSVIDSETFLLNHKGSENVKRFSVNNLLQLANCRAVTSIERAAAVANGKYKK